MPLFSSFSASSSRSLGLTSGAPPGAPTIDSSSSTATTLTINFTPVVGSFAISKFEYSLNGGAYTGNIASNAVSYEITGLTPSTSYGVRIRAVDEANQISDPSNLETRSTSAEIAPSAPSVTVTQKESGSGTPINATKLDVSFTAASAGTYPVVYHQYRVYRGATLVTDWATTPVGAGVTFTIDSLVPASSHTVYVRGVATANGTTYGTAGSASASTDTEIVNSAPTVTVNSVTTSNVTFTRGTSSGGTYGVSYYRYQIRNGSGTVVSGPHDLSNSSSQFTVSAGVGPDEYFYVDVWAISSTSSAVGTTGTAYSRLNPSTPSTPTASWDGMSSSSYGTANLTISKPAYATRAFVQVNGGTIYEATDNGSYFSISIGSQAYNSTHTYRCYVQNRLDQASGSAYRYWTTPSKNQTYNYVGKSGEFVVAATNSSLDSCAAGSYAVTFGYVPSSDDVPGYIRIDGIGIYLKTGGFSNTVTSYLYHSYPGGTASSSLEANTGSTYGSERVEYITVGGSSLSGGTIQLNFLWVSGGPAGSASRFANSGFGCLPNGSGWFYGQDFRVFGVYTTTGNPY